MTGRVNANRLKQTKPLCPKITWMADYQREGKTQTSDLVVAGQ